MASPGILPGFLEDAPSPLDAVGSTSKLHVLHIHLMKGETRKKVELPMRSTQINTFRKGKRKEEIGKEPLQKLPSLPPHAIPNTVTLPLLTKVGSKSFLSSSLE